MKSRILLINFSEKESEKLKDLSVGFDRGYLSDITKQPGESNSHSKYFFPYAIHEYKTIFVSLNNNPEVEKEFSDKAKIFDEEMETGFMHYWLIQKRPLVIFLGDYSSPSISLLGIQNIEVRDVKNNDKTVDVITSEFNDIFEKNKSEVIMPTKKYIFVSKDRDSLYQENSINYNIKKIYSNIAGNTLGCYHNNGFSHYCNPSMFLLPLLKNKEKFIPVFLKEMAKIYPKYLSEFYESEWRESEKFYPKEIKKFNQQASDIAKEAESKLEIIETEKEKAKKKFQSLVDIISLKDNELKEAIIEVLSGVFKLKVVDSDSTNQGPINHEDIVIEIGDREILAEIKGDISKYPSVKHIAQLWKHMAIKGGKAGALILNYDFKNEPEQRDLAYTGEEEESIKDIIFIDTRVMYNLALAIIDCGMSVEEAVVKLFSAGRAEFNLEEYKESLEKKQRS